MCLQVKTVTPDVDVSFHVKKLSIKFQERPKILSQSFFNGHDGRERNRERKNGKREREELGKRLAENWTREERRRRWKDGKGGLQASMKRRRTEREEFINRKRLRGTEREREREKEKEGGLQN